MRRRLDVHWLLWASVFAASLAWLALYRWYGLPEHAHDRFFAFEKIPGRSHSLTVRATEGLFLAIALAYAVGLWSLARIKAVSKVTKLAIVAAGLGPGVVNVFLYPVGALDVFNYLVELKLAFHYDQNPYLTTFEAYRADSFAKFAFLTDVQLFYGPVWLFISAIPSVFVGWGDVIHLLIGLKVLNLGLMAATAVTIRRHYRDERRGWLAAYAFVANPLVLFESVGNGHNDVMMTAFMVAAIVALQRRSIAGVALLALSALVKFFSLALAPLIPILVWRARWSVKRVAASVAIAAIVAAGMLAPYWDGGKMVDGLQAGMTESQDMDHVSPYSLAQQYVRHHPATGQRVIALFTPSEWLEDDDPRAVRSHNSARVLSRNYIQFRRELTPDERQALQRAFISLFIVFSLVMLWTVRRGNPPVRAMLHILLLFCLLLTNLYPWYLIPVVALLALHIDRIGAVFLVVQSALGLAYYPFYVWAHFDSSFAFDKLKVHLFLSLFLTVPIVLFLVADIGSGLRWRWRKRAEEPAPATCVLPAKGM